MENHRCTHPIWVDTSLFWLTINSLFGVFLFLYPQTTVYADDIESPTEEILAELIPIEPIFECIEDLGDGRFKATFSYNNPNESLVTVPRGNSRVVWNGTSRQEKVLNKFQPGLHESVLEAEFDTNTIENGLTWIIRIPKKASMSASADASSTICEPDISSIENFEATPVGTSQIDLSWDEPVANNPFTYSIERSLTGTDQWAEVASGVPQATTNYSDQGLEEFTIYYYRIFAINIDGSSTNSFADASTLSSITTVFNENGKADGKVELALIALAEDQAGQNPSDLVYQFNDAGDVLIEVIAYLDPNTISAVIDLLQQKYGRTTSDFILNPQTYIDEDINNIDVYFPVPRLLEINLEPDVNFAYSAYRGVQNNSALGETGVLSQGDSSQTTREVRESFRVTRLNSDTGELEALPVDGTGIGLGVLSNSFNAQPFSGSDSRYVTDQKNLDLPGPFNPNRPDLVNVLEDGPPGSSDEGRAMLHLIHDVAPGSHLAFHTGTQTLNKFVEGINELSLSGYQVLVDDITFFTEHFFEKSGPGFDAINDHVNRAQGNMYFTSAGNFANKAWQDIFTPEPIPDGAVYPEGVTGWIHTEQLDINIKPDGEYIVVLQWDEPAASQGSPTGAITDLDVTITDAAFRAIAGNNKFSVERDPTEIMVIKTDAERSAKLVITCECETPPSNLAFRVVFFKTFGNDGTEGLTTAIPLDAPTITGHAMSDDAVAVGASFYGYYGTGAGPDIEPFSSFGGTLPNGREVLANITTADGANTGVLSIGEDINFDEDTQYTNFFGTSAAAPHAAAAAALMLSALPTWHSDGVPASKFSDPTYATGNPADETLGLFLETATPTSSPLQGGAGLMQAKDAFIAIASQTPFLSGEFISEEGKVISAEDVLVTLIGDFFTPESIVLFDGAEMPTTYISETEIQTLIPPFSGQGKLVVANNPSSTPGGGDGGNGNGIDLLDGRRAIEIIANDATFEFGQAHNELVFSVEGLEAGETLESLGLPEVVLNPTSVGPYPDVNNYTIFPEFAEPLTQEQQDQWIITLSPGTLSFIHKDLTIQPQDVTAFYGVIPEIVMNYTYDQTGIADNDDFMNTIRSEHQATYFPEDDGTGLVNRVSALVNRLSVVVNENPGRITELLNLIENSNWMATRTTIENRASPVVNEVSIVEFDADQLLDYLDNPLTGNSGSIENRLSVVVNGNDLVNGLTSVYDPIEDRASAVVNRLSALVNRASAVVNVPLGDENDKTDYSELLAIIDAEDGAPEGSDPDALPPIEVYSINVITGTDVTETEENRHYIAPGAPLSPFFANFNKNIEAGRFMVNPLPITVDLNDGDEEPFEIDYGAVQPSYTSTIDPLAYQDEETIEYSVDPEPTDPVGAGNYSVLQEVTIADPDGIDKTFNYEITYIDGSLVVNHGALTFTPENILIISGDNIPASSEINYTITGLIQDETAIDAFPPDGPVVTYSSSEYDDAGRAAGTYVLSAMVTPEPANYSLVVDDAQVFVNLEDGKKIRVYLDCVAQNKGQSEFPFTAYFSYENDNDVSIFIEPMSPENILFGTSFDASSLPFEFLPGSHQFAVPFVGELRYQVATFGSAHNSSQQIDSDNLKGQKCKPNEIPVNGRTANPDSGDNLNAFNTEEVQFYPNPVNDYLMVGVNDSFSHNDYQLYDSQGIQHSLNAVINPVQSTVAFDFTHFEPGLYLLKLNIEGTTAIIRILRQ